LQILSQYVLNAADDLIPFLSFNEGEQPMHYFRISTLLLCSLLLVVVSGAQAQIIYTNAAAFQAATTGLTTYDFEGIAAPNTANVNPNLSPLTVSVTGGADTNYYVVANNWNGGVYSVNGTASLVAGADNGGAPSSTIQFGSVVSAFGMETGFSYATVNSGSFTVALLNGAKQVGSTYVVGSIPTTPFFGFDPDGTRFDRVFVGFTSSGNPFDRVVINPSHQANYQVFDNLQIGEVASAPVPEPGASALLMAVACFSSSLLMRRRK
jgi:hypothetical protein